MGTQEPWRKAHGQLRLKVGHRYSLAQVGLSKGLVGKVSSPDQRGQEQLVLLHHDSPALQDTLLTPHLGDLQKPEPRPGASVGAEVCQGAQSCLLFPKGWGTAPLPFPGSLNHWATV